MGGESVIYLDNAATTAVRQEVVAEMLPFFLEQYGNPSTVYQLGKDAKEMTERVREMIGYSIGAKAKEIYFTNGGTESDNWAITGIAKMEGSKGKNIITTGIEHHAVMKICHRLEQEGYRVTYLPVNQYGEISLEQLENAIQKDTVLVSVMFANNEIGTLQPISKIGKIAKSRGVYFHTDAVQGYLHERIHVKEMGIDLLSASGHKVQGPKGVGFLYVSEEIPILPLFYGGDQEQKKRAGTENVPGIVGMGKAVALGEQNFEKRHHAMLEMKNYIVTKIKETIPYCIFNGKEERQLDNIISVSFAYVDAETLIVFLDMEGICVSGGSACSTADKSVSHVLRAIRVPQNYVKGTIRISLGEENTMEECEIFVKKLARLVSQLREFSTDYSKELE